MEKSEVAVRLLRYSRCLSGVGWYRRCTDRTNDLDDAFDVDKEAGAYFDDTGCDTYCATDHDSQGCDRHTRRHAAFFLSYLEPHFAPRFAPHFSYFAPRFAPRGGQHRAEKQKFKRQEEFEAGEEARPAGD